MSMTDPVITLAETLLNHLSVNYRDDAACTKLRELIASRQRENDEVRQAIGKLALILSGNQRRAAREQYLLDNWEAMEQIENEAKELAAIAKQFEPPEDDASRKFRIRQAAKQFTKTEETTG